MTITGPSDRHVRAAADHLGLPLTDAGVAAVRADIAPIIELLGGLDALAEPLPPVRYPRTPGHRPAPADDPYNGWAVRTDIAGAASGPLAGHRIAVKDTVGVAGVPMTAGSATLQGFAPDFDATIVTRILDAGGNLAGKANCEYFCYGAGSHTSANGPVRNPWDPARTAGGSSSGSAVLVASGAVPMAVGGDQGGSIRVPAAHCGIYGLKPTHGLVPYTGVMPVDPSIDHVGPMTATVADNALLLDVLAGPDGLDPRQVGVRKGDYLGAVTGGVKGLRVGLLTEGFGQPLAEPGVERLVRSAADRLAAAGATVVEVSVPEHRTMMNVWAAIILEGTVQVAMHGNGAWTGITGLNPTALMRAHSAWRHRAHLLSEPIKTGLIAGHYLREVYGGVYYAKAQNLVRAARQAYDTALNDVDVLALPTVPFVAPPLPVGTSRAEMSAPGFDPVVNTAPFDCTGHPALSVPCGLSEGLPAGLMLVGRHWDEATLYRAAGVLERSGDWREWRSDAVAPHRP
ncbi:amidase [Paractinoplanes abujensis]|uniref:Amidase n=1 Tax=Paractinoplanes abujensis TaxID=882441 RepID=A0A7W7G2P4_9ACTN|nr:amidase [Actinoplanes abujensis]MBB4693879.1 amidase [Actinoplanes abujensis]GID21464.1 amidase [Actinoplanes abujensis]